MLCRVTIYIPLLENVIADLKKRFSSDVLDLYNISIFFPDSKNFKNNNSEIISDIAAKYYKIFKTSESQFNLMIKSELELWKLKWERQPNIGPIDGMFLLKNCDKDIYPAIHFLLKMFVTLPISNASAERSFSSLKRLKTWLRSTMNEDRLNGLALLNIHRELQVDEEKIIDRFARTKNHRLEFVI